MGIAPPVYCNRVDELIPFLNEEDAREWLKKNQLNTSDTSILVPFEDENKQIHFLKPINLLNKEHDKERDIINENIRIMGAANNIHIHGFINWFADKMIPNRVPHLNELIGDNISLVEHGFIIIYEKGEEKVGHAFVKLFEDEKHSLIDKIKTAQTNDEPRIKEAEFLEKLSELALDLDIKGGMSYFVTKDREENQHIYRQTFKQDPTNKNIEKYLREEAKWHKSKRVRINENKSQDHHIIRFLIDWCKWTAFAAISAIGAGLILGLFISAPIGTIAAAIVAVVTFVGMSSIGFAKADKNNPTTIIYGTTEFIEESKVTFFSRMMQRINSLQDFFNKKPIRASIFSNDSKASSEISKVESEVLITTIAQTTEFKANNASVATLIKSSVPSSLSLLFKLRQENDASITEHTHLHRTHSLSN